jgi:hypothetical protein
LPFVVAVDWKQVVGFTYTTSSRSARQGYRHTWTSPFGDPEQTIEKIGPLLLKESTKLLEESEAFSQYVAEPRPEDEMVGIVIARMPLDETGWRNNDGSKDSM